MVSLYARFVSDRGDPSSMWYNFPRWVVPQRVWKNLVGIEATTYSYISNVNAISVSALTGETYSNVTVNDCMLNCEKTVDKCVGFTYVANTCTLVSAFDGMLPVPSANTVYFIDGNDPVKSFTPTTGKAIPTPAPISIQTVNIPVATNVATYTTTTPHGFKTGDLINITDTSGINGMNVVTVTDSTHFTIPYIVTADTTLNAGNAQRIISLIPPTTDSFFTCASKCYSNTSCTGFTVVSNPQSCIQYTAALTTDDISTTSATSNTYLYGTLTINSYTSDYAA